MMKQYGESRKIWSWRSCSTWREPEPVIFERRLLGAAARDLNPVDRPPLTGLYLFFAPVKRTGLK
jgi:hypothetical protein